MSNNDKEGPVEPRPPEEEDVQRRHLIAQETRRERLFDVLVAEEVSDGDDATKTPVPPTPSPRISKISKSALEICSDRPPGAIIDALERRNGPHPSDRSIGMPVGAHETATEDKYDSSWAYLSSY